MHNCLPSYAVGGSEDPLRHDQCTAAHVRVVHVDKRMPWPLSKISIFSTNDRWLDVVHNSSAFCCRKKTNLKIVNIVYLNEVTLDDSFFGKSEVQPRLELFFKRIQLRLREFCRLCQHRNRYGYKFCIFDISGIDQQQSWL
jgi:hypothetical protein